LDWDQRDTLRSAASAGRLVAALRERGVDYLAPGDAQGEPLEDRVLIRALAEHEDARLRQALIALFLLHPELAPLVRPLRKTLGPKAETELIAHYMAAVYLRQIWATRLSHYLPPLAPLPDFFSESLQLSSPETGFGEQGLRDLAAWHAHNRRERGDHFAEYVNAADLLFGRLALKARAHVSATARRVMPPVMCTSGALVNWTFITSICTVRP
jgi:hypothetical protein